jgi:hypothetical protein
MYWLYRGLRRGLYPALNVLFVFFLPLLITLNYYDLLFGMVGRIKPDSTQTTREAISFVSMYLVTLFICAYFCLWLCAEDLRVSRTIDTIAGGILGVLTGMICCGVLMLFWFSMPFSKLPQFEVTDTDMFYRPQDYAMRAVTLVASRVSGDRVFSGERFMRDLRYGLPQVPTLGAGYYVSSVPAGLKVFIEPGGGSAQTFLAQVKERLSNPDKDIPPSEQKEAVIEKGRTPLFIRETGGVSLVAVVMESVPAEFAEWAGDEPDKLFANDGEVGYAKESLGDRTLYVKFYRMEKTGLIGSEIALFQPRNMTKYAKEFKDFWPAKACFRFNDGQAEMQMRDAGASQEEAKALLQGNQLRLCGKALFTTGTEGKVYALEFSAPNHPGRLFEVQPAADLNAKPGAATSH